MMKNIFSYSDGGRNLVRPDEKLDCVVRALAVILGAPYHTAHELLKASGRKDRHRTPGLVTRNVVEKFVGPIIQFNGTLAKFMREHKTGKFFIHVRGHVFVLADGLQIDMDMVGQRKQVTWYAPLIKEVKQS